MIYFARTLHVTATAIGIGCIFLLMAVWGRRGAALIDAPELAPWAISGIIFSLGIGCVAHVLGNDLGPQARKRPSIPVKAHQPSADPADVAKILDHFSGEKELSEQELGQAYRRVDTAMDRAMTPQERARRDEVRNLDVANAPVRLQVMVPPQPSDSWVGGNPSLPSDMPWPEVGGKPATFYAQIAAHHLPPDIWGWQGPRTGWLLMFSGDDEFGDALVLHTTELGEERPRPYGQVFRYYRHGRYDEQAQQMMGDQGLQPPRWPVKVVPSNLEPSRAKIAEGRPGRGFDLRNDAWLPFDWATLGIFVAELIAQTQWDMNIYRKASAPEKQAAEAVRLAALDRILPSLEKLSELIRRRAETTAFTMAERDRILRPILDLQHDAPIYDNGVLKGMAKVRTTDTLINSEYPALHDLRARHVYARDPDALHPPVRTLYEPQWQAVAENEVISMGGSAEKFESDDAVMLELAPSRLFGWTFGDLSNFVILLGKGDLMDGTFEKAQTMNNHGL